MNPRAAAAFGLGFGARQMAALGMSAVADKPEIIKATPVAFSIPGRAVFVPWPKRSPIPSPDHVDRDISPEFDDMEQALMLFAVVSLNS